LTSEQRDFAETIRSSGQTLLTIINDILDFSKIEAGMLQIEKQPVDIRKCLEAALDVVALKAAEKGLDLAYLCSDAAPVGLMTDVTRVRQILVNLLSNAVKFTERGEVVLTVTAQARPDHLIEMRFEVRDTGIGIPADRLDRLFKSFSQVDSSTSRHFGGTGLGLAISKRLSEMLGGEIGVESTAGKGSRFYFTVVAEAVHQEAPGYAQGPDPRLAGLRLLVVDDNPTNLEVVRALSAPWGVAVQATADAGEAIDWLRAGDPFRVALVDAQMPANDGSPLVHQIRKYRAAQALPLILLTSLGRPSSSLRADGAATLVQPIKPLALFEALLTACATDVSGLKRSTTVKQFDATMATRLPMRILLAEDNATNQKVSATMLKRLGYAVDIVGNGREAVEALRRQMYDLVLMDVHMPEMDGLEATQVICREWPAGQKPEIVAMTASALPEDVQQCLAVGMDAVMTKPASIDELRATLERAAGRRKQEASAAK
jgi:CheY-like chemotaxis protein